MLVITGVVIYIYLFFVIIEHYENLSLIYIWLLHGILMADDGRDSSQGNQYFALFPLGWMSPFFVACY